MRLTTALYYTPSGRSIQKIGIQPDIIVEQVRIAPTNKGHQQRESDLRGALNNGEDSSQPEQSDPNPEATPKFRRDSATKLDKKSQTSQDFQLQRALDILRGISILQANQG